MLITCLNYNPASQASMCVFHMHPASFLITIFIIQFPSHHFILQAVTAAAAGRARGPPKRWTDGLWPFSGNPGEIILLLLSLLCKKIQHTNSWTTGSTLTFLRWWFDCCGFDRVDTTLTSRCRWLAWAPVECTRRARASIRRKPCSPRSETPALLRCTAASLHVGNANARTLIVCRSCVSFVSLILALILRAAADKKMMVPSSSAGGQQLYSQSSPFQQGHSGKSFR